MGEGTEAMAIIVNAGVFSLIHTKRCSTVEIEMIVADSMWEMLAPTAAVGLNL